ncbi:hypothetical protein PybrP1_001195 [[Pythium] brassicae (nom. inval.)]|nr:hypothetical protein PybrP1_001195 [[Pythium] brassicae (nom. inval.)]
MRRSSVEREDEHQETKHGEPELSAAHVASCRAALRHGLASAQLWPGAEAAATQLEQLFERTVHFGENQSGLLLASAGSGARVTVQQALRSLRRRSRAFTLVYLNGTIVQNEIEAFKEMIAQLTRDRAVKHPALAYWNMYEYLKSLLAARAAADEPVMVVLDAFEQFAQETGSAKQLLLYNLLDWLQTKDVKMGVLGISTNFNVIDNLEKRVRSRFSSLQVVLERPSFDQVKELLARALSLQHVDWEALPGVDALQRPPPAFVAAFDARVAALLHEPSAFLASLEFDYDIGKPAAFFLRVAAAAVVYLSAAAPLLSAELFLRAKHALEQDYQLATIAAVNDHGIALMIGMSHLERDGQRFFTLEMVYSRWQQFFRKHDLLAQLPTRSEAQKALENLLRLQLVKDAGDAFRIGRAKHAAPESLQPEYRVVHLNFAPRTLEGMIRNQSIRCSTAMAEWATNGGV